MQKQELLKDVFIKEKMNQEEKFMKQFLWEDHSEKQIIKIKSVEISADFIL